MTTPRNKHPKRALTAPDHHAIAPTVLPKQELLPAPITREVLVEVPKADDLVVHFCRAKIDGVTVLDVRDYVPSTKTYGRGTTLPWNTESLKLVKAAVAEASRG